MKNIGKFGNKMITSSVVIIIILSSIALLGGAFGTGAPPFSVTFVEHNLPVGTTWAIAWNNTTKSGVITNTTYSGGGSASVSLYNGSYEFRVIGTPWWFNKTLGKFTVAGSSLTITVNFINNVSVTFTEKGLPSVTKWSMQMHNGPSYYNNTTSTGGSISVKEANSSTVYEFMAYANQWYENSTHFNVTFEKNATYTVNFIPYYILDFKEIGIFPGTLWDVNVSGKISSSNVPILSNKLLLGNYTYSIIAPIHYSLANNASGTIDLNHNITINLTFSHSWPFITLKGYIRNGTSPISNASIFSPSIIDWQISEEKSNSTGFYEINTTSYSFISVYRQGYTPYVNRTMFTYNTTEWLNVSLKPLSTSFNISSIFKSYVGGFIINATSTPINTSFIQNNITFSRIGPNKYYFASINITNKPLSILLPVKKGSEYKLWEYTNTSALPTTEIFNATLNLYNLTWTNWKIDPEIFYSSPEAVITAPSAIPYDTAITISGAGSIASTDANITNYTWHITGPVSYILYGKQINVFFSTTGNYKIGLTVTDSNGLSNSTSTTLSVLASNTTTAIKISVTHTFNSQKDTYYFLVYVNMTNNVSVSQITVSVDGKFVNATLYKEMGYDYIYAFNLSNEKYGYGNHTIKIMVFDTLGQYNSLTTYLVFGSVSGVGIISYIFTNTLLLVATAFVILALLVFVYSVHGRDEMKLKPRKRNRGRK